MAFHPVRFPLDVALGARGGPERLTDIVTLASGREERNSRWAHSRRRYNAGYGVKSRADMQAVLAFFEERRGRFHSFLWRDGLDFSSNGGSDAPTPADQAIGTGDGSTTTFQLVKRYGAAFDPICGRSPSRSPARCGSRWREPRSRRASASTRRRASSPSTPRRWLASRLPPVSCSTSRCASIPTGSTSSSPASRRPRCHPSLLSRCCHESARSGLFQPYR